MGLPPSDDDKRGAQVLQVTGKVFRLFQLQNCFQTKPYRGPQYIKQIGKNEGLIWQVSPEPERGKHLLGMPGALEDCSPPHTGSWAPAVVQGEMQDRVPAAVWGARALNTEARTLDVSLTGKDCTGGLSRGPSGSPPCLPLPPPSPPQG